MDKSPDAFRTISEVAEDLDLPQHVLRFWETRFGQIRPLKRGGGRRYYRPDDVDLLRGIRALLYGQGYTIRGVQRILKEKGIRYVQALGRGEQVAPAPGPAEAGDELPQLTFPGDVVLPFGAADEDDPSQHGPGFSEQPSAHQSSPHQPLAHQPVVPAEVVLRLNGVLTELLECRRLIASARGTVVTDPDGA